ncbi:MAG: LLM class flavin-dependent oxidoreductase [Nevskia sp.]
MNLPLSVLDLAPVPAGTPPSQALRQIVDLARLAERLGYVRYWFAEHHSMASVASAAPEILIGHAASATRTIRVGAGGMMLPNHAPLRLAEAFKTLAALHPGRIDLGIGRAPGSEPAASRALRAQGGEQFPQLMSELLTLSRKGYGPGHPYARVKVTPDDVELPPIWILGSSGASAGAAAGAGLGYSFASHFSPEPAAPAFAAYRDAFRPSEPFPKPHAILGIAAVCAESDAEATYLASTMELAWLRIARGEFLPLPSPEEATAYPWSEAERDQLRYARGPSVVGSPATVRAGIEAMAADCGADEVMVVTNVYDHAARLRSYELLSAAFARQRAA